MTGIILDVAVIVITALLLIFGIWRGMYKLIFGVVSAILALVLAILLVSPVATFVTQKTLLDERLVSVIDEPLSNNIPGGTYVIALYDFDEDGEATELGYTDSEGNPHKFTEALSGTPYAFFGGIMEKMVIGHVDKNATDITFVSVLSAVLVGYIISAIVFIVLLIVFSIVVSLLMKLLRKFVTHTYIGHFIDKILGAVLGLAISIVVVWGALAIIRICAPYEWIIPVNTLISQSTVTKFLFEHNILYTFIVDKIDLKNIFDSIFAGMGGSTTTPTETTEAVKLLFAAKSCS